MYVNSDLEQYLLRLQEYNKYQSRKIKGLEGAIRDLQNEVKSIKDKPITIEKIEYKFDQLKIETLEGTLNIGITPNSAGQIEELAVTNHIKEDVTFPLEKKYSEVITDIKQELESFLDKEANTIVLNSSKSYQHILNEGYQNLIIEDIKKQLNQKIKYYLTKLNGEDKITSPAELKELVVRRLQEDIHNAINNYIKQLPRKENIE